jgi:hypothetical protein
LVVEAPSLFEIACLVRDEARKVADQVEHPNRKYRHERGGAARIISEAIGAPYSESKLKRSGCRHAVIQGVELYADEHLIELARRLLDDAKLVAA